MTMRLVLGVAMAAIVASAAFGTQTNFAAGTVKNCAKAELKTGNSVVKVVTCGVHPGNTGTVVVRENGAPYAGLLGLCSSPAPGAVNCAALLTLNGSSCQQFTIGLLPIAIDPTFASLSQLGIPPFDATGNLFGPLPASALRTLGC